MNLVVWQRYIVIASEGHLLCHSTQKASDQHPDMYCGKKKEERTSLNSVKIERAIQGVTRLWLNASGLD